MWDTVAACNAPAPGFSSLCLTGHAPAQEAASPAAQHELHLHSWLARHTVSGLYVSGVARPALHTAVSIEHVHLACSEVEHQLTGTGTWQLPDGSEDLEIIHVPGHTKGSLCMLYTPEGTLFTGDHLNHRAALGRLNSSS